MSKLIGWALAANALAFRWPTPCLLDTTSITMVVFFLVSLPLFAIGFLLYLSAVVGDLRSHKVL